ncbi:hypothetical protein [Streptomyces galbus]|uniref:Uncharacterized protein n=1 Tax=Streptomyces galbus TaxID=33898 RepID=A0A4U5WZC0_STRGB|nr:hypothetical protein [Streptomyces galbus]TKT07995.1 hypothetical protein E4U92_18410 [Streptomyces galbus]GHD42170.1 hypothetical protein GCM10010335_44730 [Streptomyces galbus]
MIQRLVKLSGVAAAVACVLTPVGYVLATREHSRFRNAFQDHWEIIAAGLVLVVLGLLEMSRGIALCFSVLGAFEENNLNRGAASLLVGCAISALGAAVLYSLLFG